VLCKRRLLSRWVKRVSLGGSLARAALSMLERAGRELHDSGALGFLDGAISYAGHGLSPGQAYCGTLYLRAGPGLVGFQLGINPPGWMENLNCRDFVLPWWLT
jgi:hypothetical protein